MIKKFFARWENQKNQRPIEKGVVSLIHFTFEIYFLFRLTGLVTDEDTELKETLFNGTKKSNGINGLSEYSNVDFVKNGAEDEIKGTKFSWDFLCKCIISKLLFYRESKKNVADKQPPVRRSKPFEIVS